MFPPLDLTFHHKRFLLERVCKIRSVTGIDKSHLIFLQAMARIICYKLHHLHQSLVLTELIVCSVRGFTCIPADWFWPTEINLSLTYGRSEASCNRQADTCFGSQSASPMKEVWTLSILLMTVSETVIIFEYWSYRLFVDIRNGCKMGLNNFSVRRSKLSSECFRKIILLSKVIPRNLMWG